MKMTVEGYFLVNGKVGDAFITEKQDTHMTAMASNHGVEIKTEKILMVAPHREFPAMAQCVRVVITKSKENDIREKKTRRDYKK